MDTGSSRLVEGNIKARLRMLTLYYFANGLKYMVAGSGNRSELAVGYFTKYGDSGADILPLGNMVKGRVREVAGFLGIPQEIINKPPSAGLWAGQTDEDELGLSYAKIDKILYQLVDLRKSKKEVISEGFPKQDVEKIIGKIKGMEFKRHLPPIPKISARTVGHDFLYPYDRDR